MNTAYKNAVIPKVPVLQGKLIPRLKQSVAPAMLLMLSLYAVIGSINLGLGDMSRPRAGLWPFTTAIVVSLCALYLLVWPDDAPMERFSRGSFSVGAGFCILAVFIGLFEAIGFLLPAVGTLVVWLRVFGGRTWRSTVILSIAGPAVFYVIFKSLLGVPLPEDLLLRFFS